MPSTATPTRTASGLCLHFPPCPAAGAPDAQAARVAVARYDQGWSLLCNGVVLLEDGTSLPPAPEAEETDWTDPRGCAAAALPQIVLDAAERWTWAADRAERLLPQVTETVAQLTLPRGLQIVLCGRARLAAELGRRTAEASAGYIGARYRLLLVPHVLRALAVRGYAVWANGAGEVAAFVDVRLAAGGDREFGAALASVLVLAALRSSYNRAFHLSTEPHPTGRPRYDAPASALTDLRRALLDAELHAAAAAAAEWREQWVWTGAAIEHAREITRALDQAIHRTTATERAQDHARSALYATYRGQAEPAEFGATALYTLRAWVAGHGAEATGDGEQLAADRRARLAAAAWCDFRALEQGAADGEEYPLDAEAADDFARLLFEFDAAHGTCAGALPLDAAYWGATRAWRSYTRQEWAAARLAETAAATR